MVSPSRSISPLFIDWSIQDNASSSSPHHTRINTPDLTTSPASFTSSISSAFDEPWSMPSTGLPSRSSSLADLNPQAQPFVPGSFLMHNPILSKDQMNAQLLASVPADHLKDTMDGLPDFKLAPLSDWDTFSEEPLELLNESCSPSTPAYPLHPPPTCILKDLPPPALPPPYLPQIANCLRPGTQELEIEFYSHEIITTSRRRWDLESLLELSERICFEMYNPCTKPADKDGRIITACDSARYLAMDPTQSTSNLSFYEVHQRGAQRQHAIAVMVKYLEKKLSTTQSAEAAQIFMWNLRESILTRFRETWDIENLKGRAMSLSNPATSYDVRCALTLCKSIASFFNQNLINRQHITMCINILLRHFMSVEHVEALALLTLGCGPTFWDSSTFTSTTRGICPFANGREPPKNTADLVQSFLAALITSVTNFSLHDSKSLVFPSQVWGKGQLMTRLHQIEVAVKKWAVLLSRSPINLHDSDSMADEGNVVF